ncbi:substrate-binding domain-containing protein [Candidatus Pacearchaeota archaeon]|nr:substrate-binding domain-containing protein [Candidatus Pacearchaeota archaeon]
MKSKKVLIFMLVLMGLLLILGCPKKEVKEEEVSGKITISGSGTCMPLVEILADGFIKENPEVDIVFEPGVHSSGGVKGVDESILDIGTVSRELKDEEKKTGVKYSLLSNDGLVLGASKDVNVVELTVEQIKSIFSGEISNWKDVNGPDKEIVVLDRNEDESAKIILRKFVLGPDLKVTEKAAILYFEDEMIEAAKVTEGAIGYFSLGFAQSTNLDVNLIKINGIEPSVESILSGDYEILRPLGIVIKNPNEVTQKFVDFILGDEAKEIMKENGFAPAK